MGRRWMLAAAAAMLAGCDDGPDAGANLTANQLERIAVAPEIEVIDRSVLLQPLLAGDPQRAGLSGPLCLLGSEGKVLVAASGSRAVARVGGRPVAMTAAGPVGPTGGYFSAEGLSVSVGRTAAEADAGAAALAQVANRDTGAMRELDAVWRCGA